MNDHPSPYSGRGLRALSMMYVASIPFSATLLVGERSAASIISVLLILAYMLSAALRSKSKSSLDSQMQSGLGMILVGILGWAALTLFWTMDVTSSKSAYQTLFLAIAITPILRYSISGFERTAARTYSAATSIVGLLILFNPDIDPYEHRRTALGLQPNQAAALMAVACVFSLASAMRELSRRSRLLNILPILILVPAILATGSRGGLIALTCGVVFVLGSNLRGRTRARVLFVAAILFATAYAVFANYSYLIPKRVFDTQSQLSGGTLTGRTDIWATILRGANDWALTGTGVGTADAYVRSVSVLDYSAHNTMLQIALEQGVIGLVLFLAAFVLAAFHARRSPLSNHLAAGSVCLLVMSLSTSISQWRIVWLLVAIAWIQAKRESPRVHTSRMYIPNEADALPN